MKFKVILQKNILFSYFPRFLPYARITLKNRASLYYAPKAYRRIILQENSSGFI